MTDTPDDATLAAWLATQAKIAASNSEHAARLALASDRLRELSLAVHVLCSECLRTAGMLDRQRETYACLDGMTATGVRNQLQLHAEALRAAAGRGTER